MRKILIKTISFYQKWISPLKKRPTCVFYPSCSEYTKEAIQKYGVIKGGYLGFRRVLKCHPFSTPRIDKLK